MNRRSVKEVLERPYIKELESQGRFMVYVYLPESESEGALRFRSTEEVINVCDDIYEVRSIHIYEVPEENLADVSLFLEHK